MKAIITTILYFITVFAGEALACPACAGSLQNPKDKYLVYSLIVFIVLIYIPFYLLYRTIIKNKDLNELKESDLK